MTATGREKNGCSHQRYGKLRKSELARSTQAKFQRSRTRGWIRYNPEGQQSQMAGDERLEERNESLLIET
jgi:hypothetical protein